MPEKSAPCYYHNKAVINSMQPVWQKKTAVFFGGELCYVIYGINQSINQSIIYLPE